MPIETVARAYHGRQRAITERALSHAAAWWSLVDVNDVAGSWQRLLPRVVATTAAGMRIAAGGASDYVSTAVLEQDARPAPVGRVNSSVFGASASDGRPLASLLYLPAVNAQAYAMATSRQAAVEEAGLDLAMYVRTQIADAGRVAVGVAMMADKTVTRYVRVISATACARCAVLAGKVYRTANDASFPRHPQCDCTAAPITTARTAEKMRVDPKAYFGGLSSARQDELFTKAGAQAIRDGADITQVVNARRGVYVAGRVTATTEGTTTRGLFGGYVRNADGSLTRRPDSQLVKAGGRYRQATQIRLTPESIYDLASDREQAVALLRKYGYIL